MQNLYLCSRTRCHMGELKGNVAATNEDDALRQFL
jgi:hypothetical protein